MLGETLVKALTQGLIFALIGYGLFWLVKKIRGGKDYKNQGADPKMNKYIDEGFSFALAGVSGKKTKAFWGNKKAVDSTRKYLMYSYLLSEDPDDTYKKINNVLRDYEPSHAEKIITGFSNNIEKEYMEKNKA